ncbi:hypothetical protein L9F63_018539, partial [Diploptera punctata]
LLGCKWTMVIAMVGMIPFVAAQYHASFYSLVPLGILNGFATGINWVAASTYITVISEAYSKMTKIPKEIVVTRFFSIFFMFYQSAQILGSLISWLVFKHHEEDAGHHNSSLCGANFCPATYNHTSEHQTSDKAVVMIVSTYVFIMLLTIPILSLLLDSLQRYGEGVRENSSSGVTGFRLLYITFKVFLEQRSVKFVFPISFFLGLEKCFIMSSFTHAFITCSIGIMNVGFVMIAFGFTNAFTTPITSWISKQTGRVPVVIAASLLHASIITTLLFWIPQPNQEHILIIIAALWGIAEGIWMVQINALYGLIFRGKEEAAFSNYRLFRAGGYTIGYLTSAFICTNIQIYILQLFLCLGIVCYIIFKINVGILSIAFMLSFMTKYGFNNLQSSLNVADGLGTFSLAATYCGLVISNAILPTFVLRWLGSKWTVGLSYLLMTPYIALQYRPSFYTLIAASFLAGIVGVPMGVAANKYLAVTAEAYADITGMTMMW